MQQQLVSPLTPAQDSTLAPAQARMANLPDSFSDSTARLFFKMRGDSMTGEANF
jgi:hypothetical protein